MIAVPAARYAAEIEAWVRFACPVSTETQGGTSYIMAGTSQLTPPSTPPIII